MHRNSNEPFLMQSLLVFELLFGGGNLLNIKCKWCCQLAYLELFDLCPFQLESLCLLTRLGACTGGYVFQLPNVTRSRAALLNWDF